MTVDSIDQPAPSLEVGDDQGTTTLRLLGAWVLGAVLPSASETVSRLGPASRIEFDSSGLDRWDTGLMVFVLKLDRLCRERGGEVDVSGLPAGAKRLFRLATAVPPVTTSGGGAPSGFFTRLGKSTLNLIADGKSMIAFVGEATMAFGRWITGRARLRHSDVWLNIQECGADALPIVSLISFLVGMILAFVGVVQLAQFGAEIYVANLVGIAMARDIGPIMAAIIMAGRTGSAFAAQLGTMQVNEEIDALKTFGIPPIEFLVLPRMMALMLMMPLLALYADLLGILGGGLIGTTMPSVTATQYMHQTIGALSLADFAGGLAKSAVYGALVALAGCLRGMQCGRSAAAVGLATTSAVVSGIVAVVVACAIITIIYDVLGV